MRLAAGCGPPLALRITAGCGSSLAGGSAGAINAGNQLNADTAGCNALWLRRGANATRVLWAKSTYAHL
eukprot:10818689-Lingulodinium_polyedra.AAC.1